MPPQCTIPLWLAFSLQSLVVIISFTALILVLVLQQQSDYKSSVFREIDLRQDVTRAAMTAPILTRERIFSQLAERLEKDPSLHFQYGDTIASEHLQRFFNLTYFVVHSDPIVYFVTQTRYDPHHTVEGNEGLRKLIFGVAGTTSDLATGVTTFPSTLVIAPNPAFPLQFEFTYAAPAIIIGSDLFTNPNPAWDGSSVLIETVTNSARFLSVLYFPLIFNHSAGVTALTFSCSIDIHYLVALTTQSLITSSTKALLVERIKDEVVASINTGATLFNETENIPWTLANFPNQNTITHFRDVDAKCDFARNCTQYAVDDGENIVMLLRMTTTYDFRLDLFQTTPRGFYFEAGERSLIVGVVIGIVAAIVVLASCALIWFAIRGPVRQLQESMKLAAVMRNDEVSDTSSVLTEINDLSLSFMQMNDKLLQARAFMPQALLYVSEDDGSNDEIKLIVAAVSRKTSVVSSTTPDGSVLNQPASDSTSTMPNGSLTSLASLAKEGVGLIFEKQHCDDIVNVPALSLVSKKVAVLIINARGTHKLSGNAEVMEREQVRLVELVDRCTRAEKGVVDAFQGDHFVVTFNAARAVAAAGKNGAFVGLSIAEGAARDDLRLQKFSMGLSVGRALVGNVGSATMKKNCTVGTVYTNAVGLERLAKHLGRTCVFNGRCLSDLELAVNHMLLGSVRLCDNESEMAGCLVTRVKHSTANEEWLYQMNDAANPLEGFNRLMTLYVKAGVSAVQEPLATVKASPEGSTLTDELQHLSNVISRRVKVDSLVDELTGIFQRDSTTTDYDAQ